VVVISQRAAARLRHGHVWIYRSDVMENAAEQPGALVSVADERGNLVGTAFFSASSQIALRMISPGPVDSDQLVPLIGDRLKKAIELRRTLVRDSNACRLIFSEADQLPGIIADRYNDVVTVQFLTQAVDQEHIRQLVIDTLVGEIRPESIVERVDERIRELEQLPPRENQPLYGKKTSTIFTMNGIRFRYDASGGQKTGAFLDQRENYAAAARYAHGEALDVFTYQGGFALHLAKACSSVTAVDSSRPALETAEANEKLNPGAPEIEWMEANAFDLLKEYASSGRQYDTIVLDPPAFAKGKKDVAAAVRGYKEINLRAMRMLRPGGILVTCTCSHHVSEDEFVGILRSAAADSRRTLRILEKRGQAQDHPVLLTVPETSYLKCLILQA
jgi:23S rRNA (cytosine1962-C5)-methyltransferase